MAGAETLGTMTQAYLKSTAEAKLKESEAISKIGHEGLELLKGKAQTQNDIDQSQEGWKLDAEYITQAMNDINLDDRTLYWDLLEEFMLANAGSNDKQHKNLGMESEQWEENIENLQKHYKDDFNTEWTNEDDEINNHPEMFVYQIANEERRLGIKESVVQKHLRDGLACINKMKKAGKTTTEIMDTHHYDDKHLFHYTYERSDIENFEKFEAQIFATRFVGYISLVVNFTRKHLKEYNSTLTLSFQLGEDEGTVYVKYFHYLLHFLDPEARPTFQDKTFEWYESTH